MARHQRYVSTELTHFAGRNRRKKDGTPDLDAQYDLLIKILREGRLLHRTDDSDGPPRVTFDGTGSFENRTLICPDAVYFCDIPVADFGIHIEKYSTFGLSFLKSFLVGKGANPAFYIAHNSTAHPRDFAALVLYPDSEEPGPRTRASLLDRLIKSHLVVENRIGTTSPENVPPAIKDLVVKANMLSAMIRHHFLSFCVPFDASKDDTHQENYYMEREWRVLGEVPFELTDVYRVVLPREYAERFRHDLPSYFGQITFPDY